MLSLLQSTRVGLSIEHDGVRIVALKGRRVESWLTYPFPPEMVKDGSVVSVKAFQGMLSSLFFGQKQLGHNVSVSLPADRSSFRVTTLPALSKALLVEAIRREAQRDLPLEISKIHLFWQTFRITKANREVIFAGAPRDVYDPFRMGLQGSKIKPRLWDLKPLALLRSVGRSKAIILDVQQETADLVLVLDGVPRSVRALASPPNTSPEDRARQFAEEIRRSVDYYQASQTGVTVPPETPIVVTGQMAGDFHFGHALRSAATFPVEQFVCPLEAPSEFPAGAYAAALGAALKKGYPQRVGKGLWTVDFNVYPDELKRRPVPPKAVAATLALVAALAGIYPVYQAKQAEASTLEAKQAQLSRAQRQISLAKTELKNRVAVTERLAQVEAKIRVVQEERSALRPVGGEAWFDVESALKAAPAGVTVIRIAAVGGAIAFEGTAPRMEAILDFTTSLERTGQFFQVSADSMSRVSGSSGDGFAYSITASRMPSPASGK